MKSRSYSAVKGMQDILPPEVHIWQRVEATACRVLGAYGFQEIRPPVAEYTQVFTRSIGETSDIVEKEMYTFEDKGGRSITLRPECTAPIVRCYVERKLHTLPAPQKYFYRGPMFRYERPQKGRLRQFYQVGAESFGSDQPEADAETIAAMMRFLEETGVPDLEVQVNSIGCHECRPAYREALLGYFSERLGNLCPDCNRRYGQNPLRILDCKSAGCEKERAGAPMVTDHLCGPCRSHFDALRETLEFLGISHTVNPRLVRGLDYYTRTTFEVTSGSLGAQNAVAAGGRYDGLVEEFGGPPTPAIGFAVGMERLVSLIGQTEGGAPSPFVFVVTLGRRASLEGMAVAEGLRSMGLWVEVAYGGSMKSQMRRADRLGARFVVFIGDDELDRGTFGWKDMVEGTSGEVPASEVNEFLRNRIAGLGLEHGRP